MAWKGVLYVKLHKVSFILLLIGGLNWGLEGAFMTGLGDWLPSGLVRVVYVLVGLSAIYEIVSHKGLCKECSSGAAM